MIGELSEKKILVVDDEPQVLTGLQDVLADEYKVLTARDAVEALDLLEQEEVAVILSDQRMPGLSGDQFLSRAKEISKATRVMITGYADMDAVIRAINDGQVYAFLEKPWEVEELRATVLRAADHYDLARPFRPPTDPNAPPQKAACGPPGLPPKPASDLSLGNFRMETLERMVQKIPIFRDFAVSQVRQLLQAGRLVKQRKGQALCVAGDESREMYILVSGELVVKKGDVELSRMRPVDVVGEMGMVTGQPRSATVEVLEDAVLVAIQKTAFDALVKNDSEMMAKLYKNMLDSLYWKLRESSSRLTKTMSWSREGMNTEALGKVVENIPVFRGVSIQQIQQFFQAGQVIKLQKGQVLCRAGDKSTAIYILVGGELVMKSGEVELARVKPVDVVGEMGVITGLPCSANVWATENATLISIRKMTFDMLVKKDIGLAGKLYKNVFDLLCQKLEENNAQLAEGFSEFASPAVTAMRMIENGVQQPNALPEGNGRTAAWAGDAVRPGQGGRKTEGLPHAPQSEGGSDSRTKIQELIQHHQISKACVSYSRVNRQFRTGKKA